MAKKSKDIFQVTKTDTYVATKIVTITNVRTKDIVVERISPWPVADSLNTFYAYGIRTKETLRLTEILHDYQEQLDATGN